MKAPHEAIWCGEIDVESANKIELPDGRSYRKARILVRQGRFPCGFVETDIHKGTASVDTRAIRKRADLYPSARASQEWRPEVSLVVCTRNRPEMLANCLAAIHRLDPGPAEVLVVDSASVGHSTRTVVETVSRRFPEVRYIREELPGLSRARNVGIAAAQCPVVAFTDDDVRLDSAWVEGLRDGFGRRPDVACVTGLVAADRLDHHAEMVFDSRVSWADSCNPRVFDAKSDVGPLYPYTAGIFGTGANFALRVSVAKDLGGFDEALGAGTATGGGEDLDMFLRIILSGRAIAYEPAAIGWHRHRQNNATLRRQMFGYGSGLSAYMTKHVTTTASCGRILRQIPAGVRHMRRQMTTQPLERTPVSVPKGAVLAELQGLLCGPFTYLAAKRRADRNGRSNTLLIR